MQTVKKYLTRGDGHTVGSSQTPGNLEQGGMAIRWAHPKYLATFNKGGWPYGGHIPDPLQNNFKRLGGHTVGTSQLLHTFGTNSKMKVDGHTMGTIPHPLQIYVTREDGHQWVHP